MLKIFEIPICVRTLSIGEAIGEEENREKFNLAIINGKGVFLSYNEEKDLEYLEFKEKPEIKRLFLFVPAKSCTEALTYVFARCVGINFGGSGASAKAVWIDKAIAIIEYPFCFMLYKTNGDFVCGKPMPYGILDLEYCFVKDFKHKQYCPINLRRTNVMINYWAEAKKAKKIIFQGERYDFLKIRYEFDSPKVELKNISVKNLLGSKASK